MKVIHRSDQLLVLEVRPWVLGLLLIAMALATVFGGMTLMGEGHPFIGTIVALFGGVIPILIAALMVQRVRLTFDRSTGQLTRTLRSVRGLGQQGYALHRLRKASVGANVDSEGNTYRTELYLADPAETVPFTSYYTNGKRPEAMARAVNDWLGTSTEVARR